MIIFLYGEDAFRSHQKLIDIKEKYFKSDKSGSGLSVFDCEDERQAAGKIITVLGISNLLAPKRLVIVKNIISAGTDQERDKLKEFLKTRAKFLNEDKDTVLVFWENNSLKKTGALFKFLEKNSKKQEFTKLSGAKLNQWILKTLSEIDPKAKISEPALEKLAAFCGNDSASVFSEIRKLADYAGGKMITEADVDLLVKSNIESNIFSMVDALGANNKKEALRLIHERLEKGDDPFYLLSMFSYQFRNLLKISDLEENGISSEYEISKITKMHPFVIRKSFGQIRNWKLARLKEIYRKLSEMDTKIKTGKLEIKLALDKFVAEL